MPVQQNIYSYTKKSSASPSVPSSVGGSKKRKKEESSDEEDYDDFIDSEEEEKPKKKTTKKNTKTSKKKKKQESSDDEEEFEENSIRTSKYAEVKKKKKEKDKGRFPFLTNRLDGKRRPETDPDYDKSTLYISTGDMTNLTPMEQQYWKVKKNHMDKIVFFKKGKFYEVYEEDADIAKKEFDLKITERINMRMAGVPEQSLVPYGRKFLSLGYDCVRVEQIETVEERNERKKEKKTASSCVERDICDITTVATITDMDFISDSGHKYLLCIKEDLMHARYGITFLDLSMDTFYLGCIEDDNHRTQFNTLIHTINPREIIIEKGQTSVHTKKNIQLNKVVIREKKTCNELAQTEFTGFPTADVTKYFLEDMSHILEDSTVKQFLDNDLVMSSFGACLFYLKYLRKEDVLLSKSTKFTPYDGKMDTGHLILDGQTLINLDVKVNSGTGTKEGTLLSLIDNTVTAMGRRLLENWVTRPLKNTEEILDRYDAIEDIMNIIAEPQAIRDQLSNIKDLERCLSSLYRESRKVQKEVVFDSGTNKRKIKPYLSALDSLRGGLTIIQGLQEYAETVNSKILKRVINLDNIEEIDNMLNTFETQIDRSKAESEGIVERTDGCLGPEYEKYIQEVADIEKEIEEFMDSVKKEVPSAKLKADKNNQKQMMVETDVKVSPDDMPDGFKAGKKHQKTRKFTHPFFDKKLAEIKLRQTKMDDIRQNQYREILNEFSTHDHWWKAILKSISELDCLLSLYATSSQEGYCRPIILPYTNKPILRVSKMRHPTVRTTSGFIPNDINMGGDEACSLLVTGPNMGGKSTILRSSCIAVIMAQIGCFVPAECCELTLVDRIFTRIGANDRILAGESTFMVELLETSNIVRHATPRSLVILDELGRGTSTHDGYAIANSVIQYIADVVGCLCMFSTHYYELTEELKHHPSIDFYQMQCEVEKDETGRITDVIFLYQFARGVCEKSYGIQVAKKAGVPQTIVDRASIVAEEFEQIMRIHKPITYDDLKPEQEDCYQSLVATALDISERDEMDESEQEMIVNILTEFQQKILMSYSDFSNLIEQNLPSH